MQGLNCPGLMKLLEHPVLDIALGVENEMVLQQEIKVGAVPLSDTARIDVRLVDWGNGFLVDVRLWVKTEDYEGYTKKGFGLPQNKAQDLVKALKNAEKMNPKEAIKDKG